MPAYNNYYPVSYQPVQYPYTQQNFNQPSTPVSSGIIWVQGEAGAKAYPVAAGQSVLLMDSESENFYIKSTDVSGMPLPLKVYSYKQASESKPKHAESDFDPSLYVTKDELEKRLEALKTSSRRVRIDE